MQLTCLWEIKKHLPTTEKCFYDLSGYPRKGTLTCPHAIQLMAITAALMSTVK